MNDLNLDGLEIQREARESCTYTYAYRKNGIKDRL